MAEAHDGLLRDAFDVLLDAGVRKQEIVGLVLQINFALSNTECRNRVSIIFNEQVQARDEEVYG